MRGRRQTRDNTCPPQLLLSSCLLIVLRCSPLGPPGGRWRVLLTGLLSSFLLATTYLTLTRLHPRLSAAILMLTVPVVTILSSITNKYDRWPVVCH